MVFVKKHTNILSPLLRPLVWLLKHVSPNTITVLSLPFGVLAAALIWRSDPTTAGSTYWLFWASVSISLMGLLDLVDGIVARAQGKESVFGDFLDHSMDRFLDVILIVAISLSPWADMRVGLFALVGTLLTSYMGTQAQAVGAGRLYGGVLTRADRIVLLIAAPLVDQWLVANDTSLGWAPGADYALGVVLYYMAIVGTITALERFVRILWALHKKRAEGEDAAGTKTA